MTPTHSNERDPQRSAAGQFPANLVNLLNEFVPSVNLAFREDRNQPEGHAQGRGRHGPHRCGPSSPPPPPPPPPPHYHPFNQEDEPGRHRERHGRGGGKFGRRGGRHCYFDSPDESSDSSSSSGAEELGKGKGKHRKGHRHNGRSKGFGFGGGPGGFGGFHGTAGPYEFHGYGGFHGHHHHGRHGGRFGGGHARFGDVHVHHHGPRGVQELDGVTISYARPEHDNLRTRLVRPVHEIEAAISATESIAIKYLNTNEYQVPVDILENSNSSNHGSYTLRLAVPGARKENFTVSLVHGSRAVSIVGQIAQDPRKVLLNQSGVGNFAITVEFPASFDINEDSIRSKLSKGYLQVTIARKEVSIKTISIERGSSTDEEIIADSRDADLETLAEETQKASLDDQLPPSLPHSGNTTPDIDGDTIIVTASLD